MSINSSEGLINQERTVVIRSDAMPRLLGKPALRFLSLRGGEHLGKLYTYELLLRTPDDFHVPLSTSANLDLKAMIGTEMTVSVQLEGIGTGVEGGVGAGGREISGLVVKAGFLRTEGRYNVYRIVLRPWLWLATLTSDYKIFQDKTVVEIIDTVLSDYPYPVDKRLDVDKYTVQGESTRNEPRAFQVQYGETDFDFIQRLMEEWGIYWFFEHSDGKHRLVLCDHIGAHRRSPSAAYHEIRHHPEGGKIDIEYLNYFSTDESLRPGRVVVDDFDFTRPRAQLVTSNHQPRETNWGEGELFEWPGDYTDSKHGDLISRVRMEERRAPGTRAFGKGNVRGLACGQTFTLTKHKHEEANREYLIIEAALMLTEIADESGSGYRYECNNELIVQPTSEVFRMPRETPKPTTSGPQSAIVVGPPGHEVWTDEFGRVKVRFLWDRYARNDATDSCWVRVSQAWAGVNFGGIYIPRIGQEVIVGFMNGDPDRPLILGSLYNTVTPPPWDLPGEATKSGFKSKTITGGRENYSGIRFEDKKGAEEFHMQAERDMNRLTKRNESLTVGASLSVGVALTHTRAVGGMFTSIVGGAASYAVGGAESTMIGGACALNVGGAYAIAVGGAMSTSVGGAYALNVGGALSIVCGASAINMTADGTIKLVGTKIRIVGSNEVVVQGSPLQLNPGCGDGCAGGGGGGGAIPPIPFPTFMFKITKPLLPPPPPTVVPPPPSVAPPPPTEPPPPSIEPPPPSVEPPPPSIEPPPPSETPPPSEQPPPSDQPPPSEKPPPS
ncbi:type VI secretion system Vgr family protein [Burkholderia anthinoferrum]|uniref:type VI secretion system Vgr family protein n=1 Tax=Burkholderia anthinoferrum TaxID=3090833 RepID=UPI002B2483D1|nr:type VI secretion system tip protein TssI/VgrG [Burkholderia anthinoferrum]MEB2503566.1 type VI secretion system tip protein TssI/VgrG [Burkholderia anthinoferrum]